jgi:hypothetical protein
VHENVFNWYLNLFSKSPGFKNKMNSKENFELRLWKFQKLFWEMAFLQKSFLIKQKCLHLYYQSNLLHLKGFMQTTFQKPFFQNLSSKRLLCETQCTNAC